MPVTSIAEKFDGRRRRTGFAPRLEVDYFIQGSEDENEMEAALIAAAPSQQLDTFTNILIVATDYDITAQLGTGLYVGTVRYASEERNRLEGQSSVCFETAGGTQKIFQSIQTMGRFPATAPDFKGAIGVTADAIEGVEINVPVFQFTETWIFGRTAVTDAYVDAVYNLTGQTNDAPFRNFSEADCLFLGASGQRRSRGDWEIQFKFAGSPTRTNFKVGDITIPKKRGWEYLWVSYDKSIVGAGAAKRPGMIPKYAYVEQVYYVNPFSVLNIGS